MTAADSFNLQKLSTQEPAMGHSFGPDLLCKCGWDHAEQQRTPSVCPLLIDRLQGLEDVDVAVQKATFQKAKKIRLLEKEARDAEDIRDTLVEVVLDMGGGIWPR